MPSLCGVDSIKLETEREKVVQMTYDISYPPDVVYETVEDLMDMALASGDPFTQKQAIGMAINIINCTGKFATDMKTWFETPVLQQTWINFKNHFRDAHKIMKKLKTLV